MDIGYPCPDGCETSTGVRAIAARGGKPPRAALETWMRALQAAKLNEAGDWTTLLAVVRQVAEHHGDRPALVGEDSRLSYRELVDLSDAYSHWGSSEGVGSSDVVGLLMPNCPDYVAIWCGLAEIGCVVALINTSLVGDALAHAIRVSGASRIVVACSHLAALQAVTPTLDADFRVFVHGGAGVGDLSRVDVQVLAWLGRPREPRRPPDRRDRALLIGTSGTTGLPKAANITHARVLEWSFWFAGMMDLRADDRLYNCLPMYHSVGGIVAVGSILSRGGCVVIRRRFSARGFWNDIVETESTIFQYIGELCRYLNNGPTDPRETMHRLRLCCGNGLRRDVWNSFQERFQIPDILEFYAATEGNVSLYNCDAEPGAIGRIPPFLKHRFPIELVRADPETGEPYRDADGFCVRCAADEPGEAIGLIDSSVGSPGRRFDGYTDKEASARKTIGHVFGADDRWFRTGDLMRRDKAGFFHFVDRLGETFRWKGENVSTSEVSEIVGAAPGVLEAVVFGAALPGCDGRVGVAAITCNADFAFETLLDHVSVNLPHYARPAFVRLCGRLDTTGTFKFIKGSLLRDGLTGAADEGQLWFLDQRVGAYVTCDPGLLHDIRDGRVRV